MKRTRWPLGLLLALLTFCAFLVPLAASAETGAHKLTLTVGENGTIAFGTGTYGNASVDASVSEVPAAITIVSGSKVMIADGHTLRIVEGGSMTLQTGGMLMFYPASDNTGVITAVPAEGYAFAGWYNDDVLHSAVAVLDFASIDGDMTLSARFAPACTVMWNNWDNSLLEKDEGVAAGTTASYDGEEPARADDAQYTYTFSGWSDGMTTYAVDDVLPAVSADVTYTATFATSASPAALVTGKIDAIGTVEYTDACKAKIDDAREAYDALTDAQKELVSSYETLTAAEAAYAALMPAEPVDSAGLGLRAAVRAADCAIDATWDPVEGAASYELGWRADGGTWHSMAVGGTSATVGDLAASGFYELRVRVAGCPWSESVVVWLRTASVVVAKPGTSTGTVAVSWAKDATANKGFEVLVFDTRPEVVDQEPTVAKKAVSSAKTSATVCGLQSGKTYYVCVRPLMARSGVLYEGVPSAAKSTRAR